MVYLHSIDMLINNGDFHNHHLGIIVVFFPFGAFFLFYVGNGWSASSFSSSDVMLTGCTSQVCDVTTLIDYLLTGSWNWEL